MSTDFVNNKDLSFVDALSRVIKNANKKFVESVDLDINISLTNKKSKDILRIPVHFPHVFDSKKIVAIVGDDSMANELRSLGVAKVGSDDIIEDIINGKIFKNFEFDIVVAQQSMMSGNLPKCARILGMKGLMPNAKDKTLTSDPVSTVKNIINGWRMIKSDPAGIVHCKIGNISMTIEHLERNFSALLDSVNVFLSSAQAPKNKGIDSIFISSTMGDGYAFAFKNNVL